MKLIKFLLVFALTFVFGAIASPAVGVPAIVGGTIWVGIASLPKPAAFVNMSITPEIWQDFIAKNIYRQAEFIKYSFNADQYVLAGKVVHIPQAGQGVGGKRNRKSLPATVKMRKDFDITYALDEFSIDPMLITNAEKVELSYDKMDSVMREQMDFLSQMVGDWFIYLWSAKTNILRTSGDPIAAHLDGATGNRAAMTVADLRNVKKKFNKDQILMNDRYGMLDTDMMDQLIVDVNITGNRDFSRIYDEKEGRIVKLETFTLIERSLVSIYDNAGTPVLQVPFDDDTNYYQAQAADNAAAIFWQRDAVEKAEGTIQTYDDQGNPVYYGDIFSALKRLGGRIRRDDERGVAAIVQAAAA